MIQKLLLLKVLFVAVLFNYFHETNINRWLLGVTQKKELHVSFKPTTLLKLYSKMVISWEFTEFPKKPLYFQISSSITEAYLEPNQKSMMELFCENSSKSSIVDICGGSKYASALVMNFSKLGNIWLTIEGGAGMGGAGMGGGVCSYYHYVDLNKAFRGKIFLPHFFIVYCYRCYQHWHKFLKGMNFSDGCQ